MMDLCLIKCCLILLVCFSLLTPLSASTFVSDAIFGPRVQSERRLLQIAKPCPVDFEVQNYTIITSKCKGPDYSPNLCCSAFKEFACPFADQINDLTTTCAKDMLTYIGINGQYPNGLFASLCREGKDGLACPASPPPPPSASLSNKDTKNGYTGIIGEVFITATAFVMMFLQYM